MSTTTLGSIAGALFAVALAAPLTAPWTATVAAADEGPASAWASGYNSRVRLLGGAGSGARPPTIISGIEIETLPDWKTYWRNPGDAGVPPSFDWSRSVNVAAVKVLYPAPLRLTDKGGVTIGYLGGVVFPVEVTPADPGSPVALRLAIEYGVCKEICVPAQADLGLDIAAGSAMAGAGAAPEALRAALTRLPRPRGAELPGDPVATAVAVELAATPPRILIEAAIPGDAQRADAFLVTEEGGFMPLPVREPGSAPGRVRFVVDLSKDVDLKDLMGKMVFATITGPEGASEVGIRMR